VHEWAVRRLETARVILPPFQTAVRRSAAISKEGFTWGVKGGWGVLTRTAGKRRRKGRTARRRERRRARGRVGVAGVGRRGRAHRRCGRAKARAARVP
jgi:hypothetical protein